MIITMTSNNVTLRCHLEHHLAKVVCKKPYTCDGCKMDGMGERHRCDRCDFDLHPKCMSLPIPIQGHELHFYQEPPAAIRRKKASSTKVRGCGACGMTIEGIVYHRPSTDEYFHPNCANLKDVIDTGDATFSLQKQGLLSKCAYCKNKQLEGAVKKIPGWSYVSEDEDYNFHVYCLLKKAMEFPQKKKKKAMESQQSSSSNRSNSPSTSQGTELQKSKKGSKTNKWLKILKIFIGTVFSILLGDPTTLIASTMAHFVVEGLSQAAG